MKRIMKRFLKYLLPLFIVMAVIGCDQKPDVIVHGQPVEEQPIGCAGGQCSAEVVDSVLNTEPEVVDSVPVFALKYHILVLEDSIKLTGEEINDINYAHQRLNEAYHGEIEFDMDTSFNYITSGLTLDTIYNDYLYNGKPALQTQYGQLISEHNVDGFINIYVLKTNVSPNGQKLMGFTPVMSQSPSSYYLQKGEFDAMGISFEGLYEYETGSTLIHEMGHWFGLKHPWQYTDEQKKELGLDTDLEFCVNHMNYSCFVDRFTPQQIKFQNTYGIAYRYYVIKEWRAKK